MDSNQTETHVIEMLTEIERLKEVSQWLCCRGYKDLDSQLCEVIEAAEAEATAVLLPIIANNGWLGSYIDDIWHRSVEPNKETKQTASIANQSDQGNLAQRGASTLDRID